MVALRVQQIVSKLLPLRSANSSPVPNPSQMLKCGDLHVKTGAK
jgi:hypothetical protein